jgi:hypothetical protein
MRFEIFSAVDIKSTVSMVSMESAATTITVEEEGSRLSRNSFASFCQSIRCHIPEDGNHDIL